MAIEIKKVENNLPVTALGELLKASLAEGFHMVQLLIDGWSNNTNRFDKPGEAFFIAETDGKIVGMGGRNIDPYVNDEAVLRVRRVYVLPAFRRHGIAVQLLRKILDIPAGLFTRFTLHAENPAASKLYESLGFSPTGEEQTTHQLFLSNQEVEK
jgi:ribosomal protein S18 acetylase RimI-like enzyme